jgi:hypothetical protein
MYPMPPKIHAGSMMVTLRSRLMSSLRQLQRMMTE